MSLRTKLLLVLAVLLVLFAAAFLTLDFRFMQAQMAVDHSAATYSFSIDEETPLPLEQDLDLYVQAPLDLADELAEALATELKTNPYVRDINVQAEPIAAAADSVLVVEIDDPSVLFWSPFYTRSVMTVNAAYASDGEVAWIDEDVVRLRSEGEGMPVARIGAEYTFDGRAYGLISGPGYATYLADEVAQQINEGLADGLATTGGN